MSHPISHVDIRYRGMLPAHAMSGVPSSARAYVGTVLDSLLSMDRGAVRAANDATIESRACHFAKDRLLRHRRRGAHTGPSHHALRRLSLGVTDGDNSRRGTTLSDDTLMQYLSAATQWLKVKYSISAPIYDHSQSVAKPRLIPFLAAIISQRRRWREPQQKKEPYTGAMFDVLYSEIGREHKRDRIAYLDTQAVVFDWARVGVFTGSRLSEYAQSKTGSHKPYASIPHSAAAGRW